MSNGMSSSAAMFSLYDLYFSRNHPHGADRWNVYGPGFGLRCFYSKEDAQKAASEYFGIGKVSIEIGTKHITISIGVAPESDPVEILEKSINQLIKERDHLLRTSKGKKKVVNSVR